MEVSSFSQVIDELGDLSTPIEARARRAISSLIALVESEGKNVMAIDAKGKSTRIGRIRETESEDSRYIIKLITKDTPVKDMFATGHSMRDRVGLFVGVFALDDHPDNLIGNEESAMGLEYGKKGASKIIVPEFGLSIDISKMELKGYIRKRRPVTVKTVTDTGEVRKVVYKVNDALSLRDNLPVNGEDPFKIGNSILIETVEKILEALYGSTN